jgi:hypothetical protein
VKAPVFFHVRLRRGGGLAELTEVIERFTPVVQPLAPSAVVAQLSGSLHLFGVGPVDLAQRLRLQAAAWYGLETFGQPPGTAADPEEAQGRVSGRPGRDGKLPRFARC